MKKNKRKKNKSFLKEIKKVISSNFGIPHKVKDWKWVLLLLIVLIFYHLLDFSSSFFTNLLTPRDNRNLTASVFDSGIHSLKNEFGKEIDSLKENEKFCFPVKNNWNILNDLIFDGENLLRTNTSSLNGRIILKEAVKMDESSYFKIKTINNVRDDVYFTVLIKDIYGYDFLEYKLFKEKYEILNSKNERLVKKEFAKKIEENANYEIKWNFTKHDNETLTLTITASIKNPKDDKPLWESETLEFLDMRGFDLEKMKLSLGVYKGEKNKQESFYFELFDCEIDE